MISTVETKFVDMPIRRGLPDETWLLLRLATKYHAVIAGGYARYVASSQTADADADEPTAGYGDIDIFTRSASATANPIVRALYDRGYTERFRTDVAVTLQYCDSVVQVVRSLAWWYSVDELLRRFDFTVCQAAIIDPVTVRVSENFLRDEPARRLRLVTLQHPFQTIQRALKYARRGYRLPVTQIAAIFDSWTPLRAEQWHDELAEALTQSGEGELTEEAMEAIGYRLAKRLHLIDNGTPPGETMAW